MLIVSANQDEDAHMQFIKQIIPFICLLALAACASVQAPPQNEAQPVGTRVQTLSNMQNWDLDALIAIRNNAKKNNLSANMKWQQQSQHYSILLFGPLGSGSLKLTGKPGFAKLESSDGKTYTASSPEQILAQQTNWDIPVSNLYYWIRGLPVPGIPAKTHFDAYNHLVDLQQQGWQIQYLRFTSVNNIDIPNKIFLYNSELNVKIIINAWKLQRTN